MVVRCFSVVLRSGIRDSDEGVSASWRPVMGLFTEIRCTIPFDPFLVFESDQKGIVFLNMLLQIFDALR